jgi:glycosyltransferase involved in cell wall biosynthesis
LGLKKKLEEKLGSINFKIIDWNEDTEIDEIKKCSVGIMPLENTDFNKGKCGFKLIQYMACGIPTISSPLETNVKINRNYKNLHATSPEEWFQQLEKIFLNRKNFTEIGNENKIIAKEFYNTENNYLKYLQIFGSL